MSPVTCKVAEAEARLPRTGEWHEQTFYHATAKPSHKSYGVQFYMVECSTASEDGRQKFCTFLDIVSQETAERIAELFRSHGPTVTAMLSATRAKRA